MSGDAWLVACVVAVPLLLGVLVLLIRIPSHRDPSAPWAPLDDGRAAGRAGWHDPGAGSLMSPGGFDAGWSDGGGWGGDCGSDGGGHSGGGCD